MGLMDSLKGLLGGEGGVDLNALLEQVGGLDGVLDQLRQAGMGDVVDTWIANGANSDVSPDQVKEALSGHGLEGMADTLGESPDQLAEQLSAALPEITDKLSPNGEVPEGGFDVSSVGEILGGLLDDK